MKKAIKQVAFENIKMIGEWRNKYPGCMDSESRKNDLYLKIVGNAMSGLTTEEQISNINNRHSGNKLCGGTIKNPQLGAA